MCVSHSKFHSLFTFHFSYLLKSTCFSCCVTIRTWRHCDAIHPRTRGHCNTILWRGSKGSRVQCMCMTMCLFHFESPSLLESELKSAFLSCPWVFCVCFTRIRLCFQVFEFVVCFYNNSISFLGLNFLYVFIRIVKGWNCSP